MIGSLHGRLSHKQPPQIIVDCGGVGYELETPMSTFLELPGLGADIRLFTHLQVREDAQTLYGFSTEAEKRLFRALLKVSGVGAKMALSVLSAMSVGDFARCVQHEDTAMLTRIPGVGKKTAERLIIEMRDRIDPSPAAPPTATSAALAGDARGEAYDALVSLGYKPAEVKRLLAAMQTDELTAEDIIRQALRKAVS
jgi:Holliday junction DNA helicase RuvA